MFVRRRGATLAPPQESAAGRDGACRGWAPGGGRRPLVSRVPEPRANPCHAINILANKTFKNVWPDVRVDKALKAPSDNKPERWVPAGVSQTPRGRWSSETVRPSVRAAAAAGERPSVAALRPLSTKPAGLRAAPPAHISIHGGAACGGRRHLALGLLESVSRQTLPPQAGDASQRQTGPAEATVLPWAEGRSPTPRGVGWGVGARAEDGRAEHLPASAALKPSALGGLHGGLRDATRRPPSYKYKCPQTVAGAESFLCVKHRASV